MSRVRVLAVWSVAVGALAFGGCGGSSASTNATTQASHAAAMKRSNEAMHHEAAGMKNTESAAAMKRREAMRREASNMKKQAESSVGQRGG